MTMTSSIGGDRVASILRMAVCPETGGDTMWTNQYLAYETLSAPLRALFVNRTFTSHLVELRRAESDLLLEHLCRWSEQPRFQCRYRWQRGAIGMWDNRCTQHYAVDDFEERRVIQRVTVLGGSSLCEKPRRHSYACANGPVPTT